MSFFRVGENIYGNTGGGSTPAEEKENVGNYRQGGWLPTARPSGDSLQNGDYVLITMDAEIPFGLSYKREGKTYIITATIKGQKIYYENGDWVPEVGVIVESSEVQITDKNSESISGSAMNQSEVNKEFVKEIKGYIHTQTIASKNWTVTHNLNKKYPLVVFVDDSGNVFDGSYVSIDENSFTTSFSSPVAGCAICK